MVEVNECLNIVIASAQVGHFWVADSVARTSEFRLDPVRTGENQ